MEKIEKIFVVEIVNNDNEDFEPEHKSSIYFSSYEGALRHVVSHVHSEYDNDKYGNYSIYNKRYFDLLFNLEPDDPEFDKNEFLDEEEKEEFYSTLDIEEGMRCSLETYDSGELRLEFEIEIECYDCPDFTETITISEETVLP